MTDGQLDPRVMEIYALAVEMADRVSARRALANSFFLAVNTTLAAVIALRTSSSSALLTIAVCATGLAVAWCWWLLLRVYRRLNQAKFAVILRIEAEYLPIKPLTDEWADLAGQRTGTSRNPLIEKAFGELGGVERVIPMLFAAIYVVLLIGELTR